MKKILSILFALCVVTSMFAKEGDELAVFKGISGSTSYAVRGTTTDSHSVGWVSCSHNGTSYLGTNSATNHGKVKPTAADLPVVQAVLPTASTTTTNYYFYYTTTAVKNVGSITFNYTAVGAIANTEIYVVMGNAKAASGGAAYTQVTLADDSPSSQGEAPVAAGKTHTFKFASTQTDAKFYGIVIKAEQTRRFTMGTGIKLLEGATSTCTAITPTLSYASSVTVGSTLTPTLSGNTGNGTVTYSIKSGSGATVNPSTGLLTATAAGFVTIQAAIAANGGYCEGTATSGTITINAAPAVERTVTWYVNSEEYTAGSPSTRVNDGSKVTTLPTEPTVPDGCSGKVFVGWTTAKIETAQPGAPGVLFKDAANAPTVSGGNANYYAVFADEN